MKPNFYGFIWSCIALLFLVACGGKSKPRFLKSPLDQLIVKYMDEPNYSIILADMDYKESEKKYYHKYRVIIPKNTAAIPKSELNDSISGVKDIAVIDTEMLEVTYTLFEDHVNDLGMTIASKVDGKLDRETAPAGYENYVGNSSYGSWQTNSSGGSFWAFYGRYRFMSDLFFAPSYGYNRNDWNNYRTNYRNRKPYYGQNNTFGTKNYKNPNATWNKQPASFKERVRSKVSQSAAARKSRSYNANKSYSKTTRNSSRYSRSSSRSRSRGFGK